MAEGGATRGFRGQDSRPAGCNEWKTMKYLAGTPSEIEARKSGHPLRTKAAQDRLLPHAGTVQVSSEYLDFSGFARLRPEDVVGISQRFVESYTRMTAAGSRGQFGSFGVFATWGAPVVVELRTGEPLIVLIDFTRWSGTSANRKFIEGLKRYSSWRDKVE